MGLSLVIADDHPIVLDGLEQLFRMEEDVRIVARCRNGDEALRAVRTHGPDVIVLDVSMPGKGGLEVLREIQEENLPTRTVLLTVALDERQLMEAARLGVRGIVLKEMAPQILVAAVREVHAGGEWLESGGIGRTLRKMQQRESRARESGESLTPRELEIVRMVAGGFRNRGIADKLCISEGTVKIHLHHIYEKVQVSGRLELVLYAQRRGLV